MSDLSVHIGKRIRLYRKNKKLTQNEFAALIHKSKSAVSKYEAGEISMDIETLYEMADALHVSIHQLLDYRHDREYPMPGLQGYFAGNNRLYIYYLNKNSSRIVRGLLEINRADDLEYTTILFADLKDYDDPYSCQHLYYGDIHYSDSYVNLVMQNQANEAERIFINLANPYGNNARVTVGMLCGISGKYLVPIALKMIVSKTQLQEDENLRDSLRFTKDDFRSMKQTYCFSIDRLVEPYGGR